MQKKYVFCAVLLGTLFVIAVGCAWAAKVQADKENVTASRLAGNWILHTDLTTRLEGKKPEAKVKYKFTSDDNVAPTVPEKYGKFLKDLTIYMSGWMEITRGEKTEKYPFILVNLKGNPHVVYFRPREGDAMGDGESFNLMLAPAKAKPNDLLFIGGDFNNQPFRAYERDKGD